MFSLTQNYLTRGFWGDEAWTSLISQLPYSQMLKTTAADFHPPGYYTVVELVYKFLPPTEVNTRLISIVFYLLTLLMVYKLASYVKGRTFGFLSTLVVCVNPIFFTYAFEARNYTMFAFAATSSMFFLLELSKKFSKAMAFAFILFTAIGVYTHYYMFFILGAQGIYLLLFDRKILFKMLILYAAVAILYIPWLKALVSQLSSVNESYWIGSVDWKRTHYEALLRILGGEHKNTFRPLLFATSVGLLFIGALQHILRNKFERPYLLMWLWAVVPFIFATLPGLKIESIQFPFRPIFFWRYLIGSSIPLSMVIVHAADKFPKIFSRTLIGIIIILSVAIDLETIDRVPFSFREVYTGQIQNQIEDNDKIVTVLPSFAEVLYYKNSNNLQNDLVILPEGLVQFSGKSLLDAYVENGTVTIDEARGNYFEVIRDSGNTPYAKKVDSDN